MTSSTRTTILKVGVDEGGLTFQRELSTFIPEIARILSSSISDSGILGREQYWEDRNRTELTIQLSSPHAPMAGPVPCLIMCSRPHAPNTFANLNRAPWQDGVSLPKNRKATLISQTLRSRFTPPIPDLSLLF